MVKKGREARLVPKPKFKLPKVRFNGKYFSRRLREMRRSMPKGGKV